MNTLDKKGYLISIDDWMGNLGNHLIQLSGALSVATGTSSTLTIPEHPLLARRVFDLADPRADNCLEPVSGRFFYKTDCFQYPVVYDRDRRKLFQDHVYDVVSKRSAGEYLRALARPASGDKVGPDTLVINIRSGRDIFRTDPLPQNDYMQPPLSFYKHVITSNGYEDCVIVTESAQLNPCIKALLEWNSNIRIHPHTSVRDDLRTILSARHLITCHSTFSWCLALMSRNLQRLYQPASFPIRGVSAFAIDTYTFHNYIKPGEWTCSDEQLGIMLNHTVSEIDVTSNSRLISGEDTELEPSCFW